jgi:hypothetical protein
MGEASKGVIDTVSKFAVGRFNKARHLHVYQM